MWVFVTQTFAYFAIRARRNSKVICDILGAAFDGIIICDRFSAYVKYHRERACGFIQYCWAHIIRQVKAIQYVPAHGSSELFSRGVKRRIGTVFRLWHAFKCGRMSRAKLIEKAQVHIDSLRTFLEQNLQSSSKDIRKFCKGQLGKWNSLFTFIYHEGVEPTNNLAERTIRPGVQTRKISYCTRSEKGQLLRARLLTISQTCHMQQRNTLQFLVAAIHAKRHGDSHPSLLPIEAHDEQLMSA